jgi:hypothetical protein
MMSTPEPELAGWLESWRAGRLSREELERRLVGRYAVTAQAEGALIDLDRQRRCGLPEVVYGAGKPTAQLRSILDAQHAAGQPSLITRCAPEQMWELADGWPDLIINETARTVRRGQVAATGTPRVIVVTAGATDRPVAEEAVETATWAGCRTTLISDIGVAGPWRLIERREQLREAEAIVVVAGMEGALPSVVAGWVESPIIGVPTSVGYGANFQGVAPLLSMLNSCAANVAVVNIDAGFKGGYLAAIIARQIAAGRHASSGAT